MDRFPAQALPDGIRYAAFQVIRRNRARVAIRVEVIGHGTAQADMADPD